MSPDLTRCLFVSIDCPILRIEPRGDRMERNARGLAAVSVVSSASGCRDAGGRAPLQDGCHTLRFRWAIELPTVETRGPLHGAEGSEPNSWPPY
jgi:hypothetical protein